MNKVTKKNILQFIEMKKKYIETNDKKLLQQINNYIENVINKDRHYYSKLTKYNLTEDELKYCL